MSTTFELTIRDGKKIIRTASANVNDDFDRKLLDAYTQYYPEVRDDEVMFLRIVRGLFEGIMNNIVAAEAEKARMPVAPPPVFTIDGEEVIPNPPVTEPQTMEEAANA